VNTLSLHDALPISGFIGSHILTELPNFLVVLMAKFVPNMRSFVPMLKRKYRHTTRLAETELGWTQHTPKEIVIDTAKSLIELGIVK
jgi:hypothetical protein